MQRDNRGTIASLTPQVGLPRPSSTWDLQGSAQTTARPTDDGGRGAPLQIPSCWMVLASRFGASGRLLCFDYPSASPYYPLIILLLSSYHPIIIPLLSPYHPVAWNNLGSPFWLRNWICHLEGCSGGQTLTSYCDFARTALVAD